MEFKKETLAGYLEQVSRESDRGHNLIVLVEHVSRSGMTRRVRLLYHDKHLYDWSYYMPGYSRTYESITVGGCGFSVTQHVVEMFARTIGADEQLTADLVRNHNKIY